MPLLTASLVSSSSTTLSSLSSTPSDLLYLKTLSTSAVHTLTGGAITGSDNVRSLIHEYGGASYTPITLTAFDNAVIFTTFPTRALRLATQTAGEWTVHPPLDIPDGAALRFADFTSVPTTPDVVYCVCEDHTVDTPVGVINTITSLTITTPTTATLETLVSGDDFYAYPTLSPTTNTLTYTHWSHPSMPWDTTTLSSLDLTTATILDHCSTGSTCMPTYSATGVLYACSDSVHDLYKIVTVDGTTVTPLPNQPDSYDYSAPGFGWSAGVRSFRVAGDDVVACFGDVETGTVGIMVFDTVEGKTRTVTEKELGVNSVSSPCVLDGRVYFVGVGYDKPAGIDSFEIAGSAPPTVTRHVCTVESTDEVMDYVGDFVAPKHVIYDGPRGKVHGYYYKPTGTTGDAPPPLLVKAHGGPTSATGIGFRLDLQYWVSRGFAVLDVDYSGSSGYGREYRDRLKGQWGVADYNDVVAGARYCVKEGLADSKRVAIDGGSAGGYTTLCALAFQGADTVFTAGCSKYGIADLVALYHDTHKFESRYMDELIGTLPRDEKIYEERCPINHLDKLACPIMLQQGDEDKVVPPNQADMMYSALTKKGIPSILVVYEGEQHGFRMRGNVVHALESEYEFYCKVWGMEVRGGEKWGLVLGEKILRTKEEGET